MRIVVLARVTLEGLTYQPGVHEVSERTGRILLDTFRAKVREPADPALGEHPVCGYKTGDGRPCQRRVGVPGERCYQHQG